MAVDITAAVEQAKHEILIDISAGRVPVHVASFSELHDYVDANEYGGLTAERADWSTEQMNEVQSAVDVWIRSFDGEA